MERTDIQKTWKHDGATEVVRIEDAVRSLVEGGHYRDREQVAQALLDGQALSSDFAVYQIRND